MPISLEQFLRQLADSKLMSAGEVAALLAHLPVEARPETGDQLMQQLVQQQKLTAFQADQIYKGKGQSLILGNYTVLDKLGQGGMGVVLKAQHRLMERLVALKVLAPKCVQDPDSLRRFHREVKAAARLEHPHIVTAYDADQAGGRHFLVMQFVDGSDLSKWVKRQGVLPLDQALDYILQAARGLQYAHEHGVVHRDIKPANLLLDQRGTVRILDMGLARIDSVDDLQDELTGVGQIMGTVDYMAPEQAVSTKDVDARADIYALGATFWYLLVGQPMYPGETTVVKLLAHQNRPVPSLCEWRPDVPSLLEAVFRRMVAKTPEERYPTMTEVIVAIEPFFGRGSAADAPTTNVENAKLDEFLRGLGTASTSSRRAGRSDKSPSSGSRHPSPLKAQTPAKPQPEQTDVCSASHVGTDLRHELPVPGEPAGPDEGSKATIEHVPGQHRQLAKLVALLAQAPASPTLAFDKRLAAAASPQVVQTMHADLPEVHQYLQAQQRLEFVRQVHELETEGTVKSETFIAEVVNHLPEGYHKGLAKRASQAANRVRVYHVLEEAICTSASEREIVEAWELLGQVRGRVLVTAEMQQRVERAKARLPLLQALKNIPRNLDETQRRERVRQIWNPELLDDCLAATPWRDLYEEARSDP